MVTIKTWIETYEHDFKKENSTGFFIKLKPFNYKGKVINGIKVENGDKNVFKDFIPYFDQGWSHHKRRVEIELNESGVKLPKQGSGSHLIVEGNAIKSIKKWEMPTEFRFKVIGVDDSRDGTLRMRIAKKGLVEGSLTPKINYVEMPLDINKLGEYEMYLFNGENKEKEVIISNIEWEAHGGGEAAVIINDKLKLNAKWPQKNAMPKIKVVGGSKKFPHPEEKQASTEEAARKRVNVAVERAREAKEGERRVFDFSVGGYSNTNRESFQRGVQAISELIKIAKNGNQAEKEEFATYKPWQVDGSGEFFNYLKDVIRNISQNNGQGWKYNLDTGMVDWGATSQKNVEDDEKAKAKEREKIQKELDQARAKEEEKARAKLTNDFQGFSDNVDFNSQKTEEIFTNVEELKSARENNVYEEQKEEIEAKKDELAQKDFQGYSKLIAKVIQQKIDNAKVEIDKLGDQIKTKLNKLKKGEVSGSIEARQIEEEVSEKISEEVANVEVNNLLTQVQNLLSGAVNDLENQLAKIKRDFYSLKSSLNPFQQKAYQEKYQEVNQSLNALESISLNVQPSTSEPSLFRPEVVIPVVLVVALMAVVWIKVRKRKI